MTKREMTCALGVSGLTKQFDGILAVNSVSLDIRRGDVTGIVGPNGSGKTTLLDMVSGALSPDSGSIVINGSPVPSLRPQDARRYGITRTFQSVRLFEQMTVLDNVLVALSERRVFAALFERRSARREKQAEDILHTVALRDKRHEMAANLSYGQRKLLEVARALATRSDIYLFDEPFAGLFPKMVDALFNIIQNLRRQGKTVVLIEHDMDLIRKICDRIIVMDSGALLSQGPPETVLAEKKVIEAYLGQ